LQNSVYMKIIRNLFPNCYILNHTGHVYFDPSLTPQENDRNKADCLENVQEFNGISLELLQSKMKILLEDPDQIEI